LKVAIADDHALFRDSLRSLLEARGHAVVAEARNGKEAVEVAKRVAPEILLMDLNMPELDGLEATRQIVRDCPGVRVVVLTASDDDDALFHALKAGAQGYLLKNLEAEPFFALLEAAGRGEPALTPSLARRVLTEFRRPRAEPADDPDALTDREQEVLELMVEGVTSNHRLAKRLAVSENTVKFHVRNILDKLRLHDRAQAVSHALRTGLVDPKRPRP
jgi:DNA-binding NarL/FixJ family response regulator